MMIVIAPAKRMRADIAYLEPDSIPQYIDKAQQLVSTLRTYDIKDFQKLLNCSPRIAEWTYHAYQTMDLSLHTVPALLSYDGIQYSYMAPDIFPDEYYAYFRKHLRILSGLYGVLRPFDGVVPYRLELDNPFTTTYCRSLYEFWGRDILDGIIQEDKEILDLSSKQYGRILKRHMDDSIQMVTVYFYEEEAGKRREKGVYVKMARGEMVRWLAEKGIETFEGVKDFNRLNYRFDHTASTPDTYVFVRKTPYRKKNK